MPIFRRQSISSRFNRRQVCVAHKCPPDIPLVVQNYPSNKIVTSKYTVWNFIFKNLFEQFRRIANFYFLCIAIIQLSIRSPVSPATSLMPLLFVVIVTAMKQAYEDWLRHKADSKSNHEKVMVYKYGKFTAIKSQDVKVGDVVMVKSDEGAPCDLVLLSSQNPDGRCQITTANLDGETNLKVHECSELTLHLTSEGSLQNLYAVIECGPPNPDLYQFDGKLTLYVNPTEQKYCPLNSGNLLLKGATLKNTAFVFGCAIYTGTETKMVLNLKITANKFSTLERTLNRFLMICLLFLMVEATIATVLCLLRNKSSYLDKVWYLPKEQSLSAGVIFETFLSFAVLFNYIIPISLYVTLELIKFIGAKFFAWDLQLYDEAADEPAICNSSDLNEELGQVQHLFTDKTGTLTENDMQFRKCSINGSNFEEHDGKLCLADERSVKPEVIEHFLLTLVLCNTVEIRHQAQFTSDQTVEYFASSPDEKALVEACARFGVVLLEIANDQCKIQTMSGIKIFKKLSILEFTSERKRMSVIVKDEKGEIRLLCKGAEVAVLSRVVSGSIHHISQHINNYSLAGLRSLAIALKHMTKAEYSKFESELKDARCQLIDRQAAVEKIFENVEKNMCLVGATAVEDRLQDGVAVTLESLRIAGIKVWVLTGDHADTAVNISYSCGHFKRGMVKLVLLHQETSDQCMFSMRNLEFRISEEPLQSYALVIDGISLAFAIHDHSDLLKTVAEKCTAVLCCRMSPLQKSQVVKLIKQSSSHPVTAAIGDGANDVSMLQEAHVGLGIIGKEGRQAVRCSDFAFSRFHYLQRVLLVHGQYYYVRASILVQYFFYKNVAFVIPQFIYLFYNGFTPQPLYNSVFLMLYNIFFTSLPIFIFGFTEKHETEENLLKHPVSYRTISKNRLLTVGEFAKWIVFGLWHCFVFFFGVCFIWQENPDTEEGLSLGMWTFGTVMFHIIVITVNLKLALHTRHWTIIFSIGMIVSIFGFMGFSMLYSGIYWSLNTSLLYGVYLMALSTVQVWFLTVVLMVAALLPDSIFIILERHKFSFRRLVYNVHSYIRHPHQYFRFTFTKHNDQPGINLSQINIFRNSFDSDPQEFSG